MNKVWHISNKQVTFCIYKIRYWYKYILYETFIPRIFSAFRSIYIFFTGRSKEHIDRIEKYLRSVRMLRNYDNASQDPVFSEVVTLDLSTVVSSVSGPKRPHDRVSVSDMQIDFRNCLVNKVSVFKYFCMKMHIIVHYQSNLFLFIYLDIFFLV